MLQHTSQLGNFYIYCGKYKSENGPGCTWTKFELHDGSIVSRRKVGDRDGNRCFCGECYAPAGTYHHFGCSYELCPVCGDYFYRCKCALRLTR